jgi:hypothetical protein
MFSASPKTPIWNEMHGFARQVFIRMLAPTVVVGLWGYAHMESVRARQWISMWKEGDTIRIGNPYTAPLPPRPMSPPEAEEDRADSDIEGVATAAAADRDF